MSRTRVVVTGLGVVSPIGCDLGSVTESLSTGRSGVLSCPEWGAIEGIETRLGAPVIGLDLTRYPRKRTRAMGRLGLLSLHATEQAVADSGLEPEALTSGAVGLAYGSTHGSSSALLEFVRPVLDGSLLGVPASQYLKFMSHTTAATLARDLGIRGRIIPTNAACASGSLAVGYGYESIRAGKADAMICGGAEELHVVPVGVFDILRATSTRYNERPGDSPRPFDVDRDGLVVGEGAGTVVLESLESARRRGAHVHAEVLGFGTSCDGEHVTAPSARGMAEAMRLALADARLPPDAVEYVNAHATATIVGDEAESAATHAVVGGRVPVSSTKGQTGHTLGASGAHEVVFCIAMMRAGFLAPCRNLERVDPRCAPLAYLRGEAIPASPSVVMTNNFAFGGIDTSIVLGAFAG